MQALKSFLIAFVGGVIMAAVLDHCNTPKVPTCQPGAKIVLPSDGPYRNIPICVPE